GRTGRGNSPIDGSGSPRRHVSFSRAASECPLRIGRLRHGERTVIRVPAEAPGDEKMTTRPTRVSGRSPRSAAVRTPTAQVTALRGSGSEHRGQFLRRERDGSRRDFILPKNPSASSNIGRCCSIPELTRRLAGDPLAQDSAAPTPPPEGAPAGRLIDYPRRGGPTVLRILLGAQLRRLREERGISTEEAGYEIRGSHSKISRMELGRVGFKERDVADLLTLYGVHDPEERAPLLELAKEANTPGWWHRYGDVLPSWFEVYLGLEEAASLLRTYELQFVPGLLQAEDYARAVVRLGFSAAAEDR